MLFFLQILYSGNTPKALPYFIITAKNIFYLSLLLVPKNAKIKTQNKKKVENCNILFKFNNFKEIKNSGDRFN